MIFDFHNEQDTERQDFTGSMPTNPAKRLGMAVMRGGVNMANTPLLAASALREDPEPLFKLHDEIIVPARKHWTPDEPSTSKAMRFFEGLAELPLQLVGGPATLAASTIMNKAEELVEVGVAPMTAVGVGTIEGAVQAATMAIPAAGKTIRQTLMLAGVQPVIGAAAAQTSKTVLESQGYSEQAKAYDPFDVPGRGIELALGLAFGGLAHYSKVKGKLPVEMVDAIDTVENSKKVKNATPFTDSAGPAVADAHVEMYNKALEDVNAGRPVDVSPIIRERMAGAEIPYRTEPHPEVVQLREIVGKETAALAEDMAAAEGRPQLKEGQLTHHDTPEIVKAREDLAGTRSTHEINTPERLLLRQSISDELYSSRAALKNREAYIVLGSPAAGKSSIAEPLAQREGAMIIDSNQAKERLPEYGKGEGAGAVHRESDMIRDAVLSKALDAGDNIVMPLVGRTADNVRDIKQLLQDEGYSVHLRMVDLHPERAAQRAVTRFNETGHFVDPNYIVNEVGLLPRENYRSLKQEGGWKSYEAYSTDVAPGEGPRLIEVGPASEPPTAAAGRIGTDPNQRPEVQGAETHAPTDPLTAKSRQADQIQTRTAEHGTDGHDPLANDVETLLRDHGDVSLVRYDADGLRTSVSARQILDDARADVERTRQLEKAYQRAAICLGLD